MSRFALSCTLALLALSFLPLGAVRAAAPAPASASYTVQQAESGRLAYYESCAECHGGKLEGVFGPALAGGDDNLQWQAVKDVYAYMAAHMPHGDPESLPSRTYLSIMAFLMQSHGIAAGPKPLSIGTVGKDTRLMGNGR